jgi:hypothetical protein
LVAYAQAFSDSTKHSVRHFTSLLKLTVTDTPERLRNNSRWGASVMSTMRELR